ncbi:hypothetical protein SAMN06309944_0212 [Micrococcales bacterium KH10]|nr:hypothetical protein SAMN06309944_0212 [Micrococcales bacterium KH10]
MSNDANEMRVTRQLLSDLKDVAGAFADESSETTEERFSQVARMIAYTTQVVAKAISSLEHQNQVLREQLMDAGLLPGQGSE